MQSLLLDLLQERRRRTAARNSFEAFCIEALKATGETPAAHHLLVIHALQKVADGETKGLIINMPPGSAKSTYASVLFPAWVMQRSLRFNLLGASHTASLAEFFSGRVQKVINENENLLGYAVLNRPKDLWEHSKGGNYKAAGATAAIAGFRADGGVIDDPIGLQADAENPNFREKLWAWYEFDFLPRLKPEAWQVIIQTRWHEDDLSGRLISRQPENWVVLSIPAEAGDPNHPDPKQRTPPDPLGRAPGEMLWGDQAGKYNYAGLLVKAKARSGPRVWGSLYQQNPKPMTGGIFKTEQIRIIEAAPATVRDTVRAWDLAATKQIGTNDPDWTCGVKLSEWPGMGYVVHDVRRFREDPEEVERAILATAERDGVACPVLLPQDPGQAGKSQIKYLTRRLAKYTIKSSPETGDKATRANPVASQANVGCLFLVRGEWNEKFIEELATFPGPKDDQVDALSRAFNEISSEGSIEDRWRSLT